MFASLGYSFTNNHTTAKSVSPANREKRDYSAMNTQQNIARRIELTGLSLNEVAKQAGIKQSVLYKIASREYSSVPKLDTLVALAKYFECYIEDLLIPAEEITPRGKLRDLERQLVRDFSKLPEHERAEVLSDVARRRAFNTHLAEVLHRTTHRIVN